MPLSELSSRATSWLLAYAKLAWIGDRNGSSGNEIGQSPRPARWSWPARVNDTPSSPSPRISVSLARAACMAPPKNSVLRPGLASLGSRTAVWIPEDRGPTRVSTSKFTAITMRLPQWGQNRCPGVTIVPHLLQRFGSALATCAGGAELLARFVLGGRGSSATAAPHRVHCGTPIGVSALHASQTRPTSIRLEFYPLGEKPVKERDPARWCRR